MAERKVLNEIFYKNGSNYSKSRCFLIRPERVKEIAESSIILK